MPILQKFRENWVRPALFFGNNPISLAGGAITTASGVTMIGSWMVEIFGRPDRQSVPGHHFLPDSSGALYRGAAADSARHVSAPQEAAARRPDPSRVSQGRPQRPHLPSRHRYRADCDHRQPAGGVGGELSRRGVHGFAAVLRAILPRDASRVRGLQGVCAFQRRLRAVPHRHRRQVVLSKPR